jgi:PBP1b-binding outer membrane lipoprotein LpoB
MKNVKFVKLVGAVSFLAGLMTGCASAPAPGPESLDSAQRSPKTVTLNIKNSSFDEISKELSQIKTSQVTVSTKSLKSLIVNQKTLQNECRNLSSQLEALKSLDVEEYRSHE